MIALLVIDMQVILFANTNRYQENKVIDNINRLSAAVRENQGVVIFIQHEGGQGSDLEFGTPEWQILPQLTCLDSDLRIRKTASSGFFRTELQQTLSQLGVNRLIFTGCATEFCVDSTLRSATERDYQITVAADAHTTANREHLDAKKIIEHHNFIWQGLIVPGRTIEVQKTDIILSDLS